MSKRERSSNSNSLSSNLNQQTTSSSNSNSTTSSSQNKSSLTRSTGVSKSLQSSSTTTNQVPLSSNQSKNDLISSHNTITSSSATSSSALPNTLINTDENSNSSSTSNNFEEHTRDQTQAATSSNANNRETNQNNKTSDSFLQRIKKRTISGVINSDADAELTCPICFDIIDCAHVTKCGHSFCQNCIQTALEHTHRCPKCNTQCSIVKDVFPNFTLNQIIERYKEETNTKKCKLSQNTASHIIDMINSAQEELNVEDVNQLITLLAQKKEELKLTNKKINELLLYDFLKHLEQSKTEELYKIQQELQTVNENCRQVEENLANLKAISEPVSSKSSSSLNNDTNRDQTTSLDSSLSLVTSGSLPTTSNLTAQTNSELKNDLNKQSSEPALTLKDLPPSPLKLQSVLASKKRIVHRYFDELSQTYVQSHNTDLKDFNLKDCSTRCGSQSVLDQIRDTVSKITQYTEFKCVASVNYNNDQYSMSSIVSSVDFDKSYEHFAMAGVTKRIKIFDFNTILGRPYGVHYPLYEMTHNAKLSCISWNRYFRQQLACSDYEGVVTLWDAEAGNLIRSYQEHEKRCWGVQFCDVDPRLLASASDDSKVKIWSTNSEYSLLSIDAKSNVCCVVFKPDSKFHVLFGTADHSIHYYDLRNPKEAVSLFKGHKKAVSYVKFSGENEFVSASTDSNLKMWKLNEGQCIRSFTGHINEKNFVGLEARNGYIVTGSENNTVYLYSNEISKPLITHKFDDANLNKKDEGMNDFVSAVCWSNENYLLAANSQGIVKVLELV